MRKILAYLFILAANLLQAQDKIYFLNGSSKEGKVLEINPEQIQLKTSEDVENLNRNDILLIKFSNGTTEIINTPTASVIHNPSVKKTSPPGGTEKLYKASYASINTLALCNADVSAFYEYVPRSKFIGLGVMGAYNFNLYATASNLFIAILPESKKIYDIGVTLNLYPSRFERRTTFYYGLMTKYTSFRFSNDTSSAGSPLVTYKSVEGSQLATLFTFGTHTRFSDFFFVKTLVGFGAFKLKGTYKEAYNREINRNSKGPDVHFNYLPKMYVGINAGFNF